ncbi:DUF5658 family protein [Neobacillus bataviensis]|uniref:DUF5658 family protein n=1 Tax=Neobacillus bataviensis TaxID=220685 RepID=UPI001CC0CA2F|nr:DUF5658 family protein [Neobacillus bataviensis]
MKLCLFLLFAGILDAVLTHFGIVSGFVEEGNPIMEFFIEKSWSYFYLIKILLPIILLGLVSLRPFRGRVRTLLFSASVLYFSVLIYHIVWILLYLNTST